MDSQIVRHKRNRNQAPAQQATPHRRLRQAARTPPAIRISAAPPQVEPQTAALREGAGTALPTAATDPHDARTRTGSVLAVPAPALEDLVSSRFAEPGYKAYGRNASKKHGNSIRIRSQRLKRHDNDGLVY